jgi:hypothetical protein
MDNKKRVELKDLPKSNKFAIIFFLISITLLFATCVGTCISSDSKSEGIDSVHIEITAKFRADKAVKLLLKAPSTAQFDNDTKRCWIMPDSTVVVKGAVDAQNSFGAIIRNSYYVKFKWNIDTNKQENWTLIDVKLE